MKRKLCITIAFVFCLGLAFGQGKKPEADFKKQCSEIANAFAKKNNAVINKYINSEIGIYVICRPGAINAFVNTQKADLKKSFGVKYPYKDTSAVKKHVVMFGAVPKFNCGDMKWSKQGFWVDSAGNHHPITEIMDFREKHGLEKYTKEDAERKNTVERQIRKVVYTEIAKDHGLVFYLSFIKGKWYLTVVDTTVGNCGA